METFDTNVVLRMVASGGIFLPTVVLVELTWVLRVAAKFDRSAIAAALESVCDAQGVDVEEAQRVRRAIARFKIGAADFSDCLILETARDAGALPVRTFDERFARESDAQLLTTTRP